MKISDYKNEEALDLLADIIEPCSEIFSDDSVQEAIKNKNFKKVIAPVIKHHKKEIIEILARLDGKSVDEYECNVFTLPIKVLELLSDKALVDFFSSQALMSDEKSSTEHMDNILEIAKM